MAHEPHSEEAMYERLVWLAQRHGKAELARKTGEKRQNLHRYLKGGRIPAHFCGALERGLGVNPRWFLSGEGGRYLQDVSQSAQGVANDLLELVQAMGSVERMQLGALGGKPNLQAMRALSDALNRHEELDEQLNQRTRPLLQALLVEYESSVAGRDFTRAEALKPLTEQVARLCRDDALGLQLDKVRCSHEHVRGNSRLALDLQWNVFVRSQAPGLDVAREALDGAYHLALAYAQAGRLHESRRLLQIAFALIGERAGVPADVIARFSLILGRVEIAIGNLREGLDHLREGLAAAGDDDRKGVSGGLPQALLLAGMIEPDEAFTIGPETRSKAIAMSEFAIWSEDARVLRAVLDRYATGRIEHLPADSTLFSYLHALLKVTEEGGRALASVLERPPRSWNSRVPPEGEPFDDLTIRSQLKRLGGDHDGALADALAANEARTHIPPEYTLDVLLRAQHHRNLLLAASASGQMPAGADLGALLGEAERFFRLHIERGYRCFVGVRPSHLAPLS